MRAMKRTSLTFGPLVNVPIGMFKATDDGRAGEIDFHQHHGPSCLGRIRYKRTCEDCGAVVDYQDIVSGTEVGEDKQLVIVSDDELDSLAEEIGDKINIELFCGTEEVDPIMFDGGTYYLEPDGSGDGYALIRAKLVESDRVGIVRFVMRTKIRMGVLRVVGNVLVIHTMLWFDQIRSAKELKGLGEYHGKPPSQREMDVAGILMDSLTREFDPTEFSDGYTERLIELVTAKAEGGVFEVHRPTELDTEDVSDLLAKLEASVQATKKAPAKRAPKKKVVA